MSKDVNEVVREAVGRVARETLKNLTDVSPPSPPAKRRSGGGLSGVKGLAAGAGMAALAMKGASSLKALNPAKAVGNLKDDLGDRVEGLAGDKIDEAGGAGGMVKSAVGSALPFGGGGDDSEGGEQSGMPGVGKGRRMPIQQSVDVAVPLETAYNQWTQFEDWPEFMHRVTRVTFEDDCTVSFATKIWGKTKEFKAEIITQRPDDRVMWRVTEGITHSGLVSFHELAPRLTRIEVDLDVDPGSLIEKAARGMRHIKRAVRADLHRFKAFIEMQEFESGAWRGVIEDGEVVEEHDEAYDKDRDYAEVADIYEFATPNGHEDEEDEPEAEEATEEEEEPEPVAKAKPKAKAKKRAAKKKPTASRSRSRGGSSNSRSKSRSRA